MPRKTRKTSRHTSRKPYRVGRAKTGLGLFATAPIKKGKLIVEYSGRRVLVGTVKNEHRYMFELNSRWMLDGSPRSNIARYANHSCRPNAESDIIKGKVMLRAIKKIQPGDEITYDYGRDHFNAYIKPIGCKCVKCIERRREERAEKRRKAARQSQRAKRKRARA